MGEHYSYRYARVRPCVPCVPCVSRLPPVSFYRYLTVVGALRDLCKVSVVCGDARRIGGCGVKLQRLKGEVDNPLRNKAMAQCEHTMHRAALVPSASPITY